MRSQWYYEVVNSITGVIRCQYDGLILPIVLLGIPIAAMLAHLWNIKKYREQSVFSCSQFLPSNFFIFQKV